MVHGAGSWCAMGRVLACEMCSSTYGARVWPTYFWATKRRWLYCEEYQLRLLKWMVALQIALEFAILLTLLEK
jgi:hypothetical protein